MYIYNYIRIKGGDNMKGIPYEVATISLLPECWIWSNRQYIHSDVTRRMMGLPTVKKEYEEVLKELGIPYRMALDEFENEVCEYWSPDVYGEEEVRLPVYAKMVNNYRYVGKYHVEKKPTLETVKSASELRWQVEGEIEKFEKKKKREEFFQRVKECLGERQAVAFYDESYAFYDIANGFQMDYVCGEDRIKAIPVIIPRLRGGENYTNWYACFNANKIELNSVVRLEKVPKGKAGMFIGTKAWQTKEWCRNLGIKFIQVVEL